MIEKYPFFREAGEQTKAAIGEDAIAADLNGTYQKPYAVLTQKRLYCKNERGNFITDAAALRSAGKGVLPGHNWFLWVMAACVGLALVLLCVWYWFMGGQRYIEDISYSAINNYQASERRMSNYEQIIRDYEAAQREVEQLQQELDLLRQELDQLRQELYNASLDWNQREPLRNSIAQKELSIEQQELSIAQKEAERDSIPVSDAQKEIQRYNDSKPAYQGALTVILWQTKLFLPLLAVFAVFAAAVVIFAAIKRTRTAVIAALASVCAGLMCSFLPGIIENYARSIFEFFDSYFYSSVPLLFMALRILLVLSVPLGVLALVRNRKNAVFQIVHATGTFSFAPGGYTAWELQNLEQQVKALRAGGTNGR